MAKVLVSEARLPRDFERYARELSLLELSCEPGEVPGRARLESCARQAPEGFCFSLVLPSALSSLEPTGGDAEAWKQAHAVERVLRPGWWVVRTPAAVRPTRRAQARLSELFARLRDSGARVAWEPGGLWEAPAAAAVASELGAVLVQDVLRAPPVPAEALYARLLALGRGVRIGHGQAERVAERVMGFAEAVVVVEGRGAREVQKALRRAEQDADEWADADASDAEAP